MTLTFIAMADMAVLGIAVIVVCLFAAAVDQ